MTSKTILFASLMMAMILPFSVMDISAAPNENASDKAKEKEDRTKRENPNPPTDEVFKKLKSKNLKHEYNINKNKDGFVYPNPQVMTMRLVQ